VTSGQRERHRAGQPVSAEIATAAAVARCGRERGID
jgi:hypothetical protein